MDRLERQKQLDVLIHKAKAKTLTEAEKFELHLLLNTKTDDTKKDYVKPPMGTIH